MNYTYEYPRAMNTVDAIIVDSKTKSKILLIQRLNDPYKNCWALPGGFIEMDETLEESVIRETMEETSLAGIKFEQFRTYGNPGRDPRGRNITVAFYGFCKNLKQAKAGDDAGDLKWFSLNKLPELGFDHQKMIKDFTSTINLNSL